MAAVNWESNGHELSHWHFTLLELWHCHFNWVSNTKSYAVWENMSTVQKTKMPIFSKVSTFFCKIPVEALIFIDPRKKQKETNI